MKMTRTFFHSHTSHCIGLVALENQITHLPNKDLEFTIGIFPKSYSRNIQRERDNNPTFDYSWHDLRLRFLGGTPPTVKLQGSFRADSDGRSRFLISRESPQWTGLYTLREFLFRFHFSVIHVSYHFLLHFCSFLVPVAPSGFRAQQQIVSLHQLGSGPQIGSVWLPIDAKQMFDLECNDFDGW